MLTGKNIILRPLKRSDMEQTKIWRNDLETIRQAQLIRFPKTEEMEMEWWDHVLSDKNNKDIYFGIDEISTGDFIGIMQLNSIDWISRTCVWGLVIGDKKKRNLGYGTEACQIILGYAFNVLNMNKVYGFPVEYNQSTLKMHQKIGKIIEEGRLKNQVYFNNKYYDVLILSAFREDYIK
jgi:RimJ/RimL family protein N-acetyltransferase